MFTSRMRVSKAVTSTFSGFSARTRSMAINPAQSAACSMPSAPIAPGPMLIEPDSSTDTNTRLSMGVTFWKAA
jgi:hypothetical protein